MKAKKILLSQGLCAMLFTAALALSKPVFSYGEGETPLQSGDWLYYDRDGHISVCGYLGKEEHITIPTSIDGKEVTELCYNGIDENGNTSLYHSENVFFKFRDKEHEMVKYSYDGAAEDGYSDEELTESGFSESEEQEETEPVTKRITIPDTVKSIGGYTFYGSTVLEQVDMPQGLTAIETGAFEDCINLIKADIPTGTERIGVFAFAGTSINELTVPDTVSYIGALAFYRTQIKRLELPDSVKYIGDAAFEFCTQLESVKLPNGLKEISSDMFRCCERLESVEIPDTVRIIGAEAFAFCTQLESVKLPKGITKIPQNLFSGCASLESVEIPEGVQTIEHGAFAFCTSLEEVYLPKTLKSVADIFLENSALKNIYFAADKDTVEALMGVNIFRGNMVIDDYTANYDNVQIHYGEKDTVPEEKTAEDIIKDTLKVTAIVFSSLLLIALCLTLIQKAALKPKKAEQQGNVLTKFDSHDMTACKHCGAASGREAKYCYNCGKKLTAKPPKGSGKEQSKI